MSDLDRFVSICQAIWGNEWHRRAALHLGKSRRTIVYWANGEFPPSEGWPRTFESLLGACPDALIDIQKRQQTIINFKRTYSGAGR